jgi:hypothetical protein
MHRAATTPNGATLAAPCSPLLQLTSQIDLGAHLSTNEIQGAHFSRTTMEARAVGREIAARVQVVREVMEADTAIVVLRMTLRV